VLWSFGEVGLVEERSRKTEKRIAEWIAIANRKEVYEPVRGYSTRYDRTEIDRERAGKEAAEATAMARQFLMEPKRKR
jgi:hypothetical protein